MILIEPVYNIVQETIIVDKRQVLTYILHFNLAASKFIPLTIIDYSFGHQKTNQL